ncbi:MAG TPA: penicillin-binding protein 1A [Candidatus Rifleibacterium sp.]|nr:penicillin-binding protein 1A [Candidatus Rifleibacterium sp.]
MLFNNGEDPEEIEDSNEDEEEDESETITQKVIGWLWFFFKLGFVLSIIAVIVVTGAVIGIVKGFSEKIPIIADNSYRPNLTTQVFDTKGLLLANLHAEENRTRILPSQEIPDIMKHAVVAIEDERFYEHYGIDMVGIARAMAKNIKAGRVVQGASTLTQQLVKNAFLTSEKTFKRKAIEAMMAFQLERKYSKEEILTLYLNEIYFGHGAYGLAAASELYFAKDPKDLTIAECAMLAGVPKSPVAFSPIRNPKNNEARRALVLAKMVELGFITPAQYEEAKVEKIKLAELKAQEVKAPYFVTYVRDQLLEKYGANLVYNGGLKVYTSLDFEMQQYADAAMASAPIFKEFPISKYPGMNGSLVCLDPKNGHIKALYGGRSFEQSQFNRVTQAYRQPGSSFKPFVYACALEEGSLPGDPVVDEYISYTNPWTRKVWSPKNYDLKYHGTITLMKALCKSFNVPAVKLIDKLTPAKVIRFTKRLGVTAPMEPNLSLALGSGQFTPLEMASAYGVFANSGIYSRPLSILKVVDRDGNILEENLPKAKEVMKAVNAAMICDMLRTAVERGTGARAKIAGRTVAGKTGTTNDYVDAWFNGFTPELVTIVQFGFDMPKTLGKGKAGGSVCGPVWKQFMEPVLKNYPNKDFPVPDGAVRCRVCMGTGKLASKGCPGNEVVSQVYPIESQPLVECRHGGGLLVSASNGYEAEDDDAAASTNTDSSFMPDPDFFRGNYQTGAAQPVKPPAVTGSWISQDNPDTAVLQSSGARPPAGIPADGFLDDDMADAPAVEDDLADAPAVEDAPAAPIREPGVITSPAAPGMDFREDYN